MFFDLGLWWQDYSLPWPNLGLLGTDLGYPLSNLGLSWPNLGLLLTKMDFLLPGLGLQMCACDRIGFPKNSSLQRPLQGSNNSIISLLSSLEHESIMTNIHRKSLLTSDPSIHFLEKGSTLQKHRK